MLKNILFSSQSNILKSGLAVVLINAGGIGLTLLGNIFLARLLGPSGYGQYAFVILMVGLAAVLSQAGLPQLLIRQISILNNRNQNGLLKGLIIRSNQISIGGAIAVIIIAFVLLKIFSSFSFIVALDEFMWGFASLPLRNIASIVGAILLGLSYTVSGEFLRTTLQRLLDLILIVVFVLFVRDHSLTVLDAFKINIISALIVSILAFVLLKRAVRGDCQNAHPQHDSRRWLTAAQPFFFLTLAQTSMTYIDSIMVGFMTTSEDTGIYRVAVQASSLIVLALGAVNTAMASSIAKMYDSGEQRKLQRLITLGTLAAVVGALPLTFGFVLFGSQILGLLFGAEYTEGSNILIILSLGQFVNAAFGPVGFILSMTGNAGYSAIGAGIAVILNICLNVVLIPSFGLIGAACSAAASLIIWNLILFYFVWKKTRLLSFVLIWRK